MFSPSLTDEKIQRIKELVALGNMSRRQIADAAGVSETSVGRVKREMKEGTPRISKEETSQTEEVTGDTWTISIPKTRICTEAQLIEHCKIDLTIWEIEKVVFNKWDMGYKDNDGKADALELFQVKAFCKRRKNVEAIRNEIAELKELAKTFSGSPIKLLRQSSPSGNMLELNLPDHHFGKLAWAVETGGPNYDVKIAESIFREAVSSLLSRLPDYTYDEIVFVLGNDLLQSDNPENQTTGGTVVSCDGRYHKTYRVVRTLMIEMIEMLRSKAHKVKVIVVGGNHDRLSMWHLGDSLECYFHKYEDVEIDNEPRVRKYHQFGKVMLMFTHGDKGKLVNYPMDMAIEEPEMWAATKFRECHTGHKHTKQDSRVQQVGENHGVRVRILSALCPPDDWHSENGYIGNLQSSEAFLWNREEGLIASAIYNVNVSKAA